MATFVVDGDTLVLRGGEKLRLIGIDAPELGRDGAPDKPLSAEAKQALQAMIRSSSGKIRLLPGRQHRDRHRRLLAHVYGSDGDNLSESLLRRGLAYEVTIPPNDRFATCYQMAQAEARRGRRGLWGQPALNASQLPAGRDGFERIAGRVEQVRRAKKSVWLELEGALALRIANEDLHRFDQAALAELPGREIEVRGWLYHYRGRPRMRVRHPSAILYP